MGSPRSPSGMTNRPGCRGGSFPGLGQSPKEPLATAFPVAYTSADADAVMSRRRLSVAVQGFGK